MTLLQKHEHQEWQHVPHKKNNSLKNHQRTNQQTATKEDIPTTPKQPAYSLCIPRVNSSLTKDYIYSIFNKLDVGVIEKMTEIPLRTDSTHKRIIICIRWNKHNPLVCKIKEHLSNSGCFKLVHDMPWYWKVVPTHNQ